MECQNLCTAEKCAELEQRITDLEAQLDQHLNQNLPNAHGFNGNMTVAASIINQDVLTITVTIDGIGTDSDTVVLPSLSSGNVAIDAGILGDNNLQITVNLGEFGSDTATVQLPNLQGGDLSLNSSVSGKTLNLSVNQGDNSDSTSVNLPFLTKDDGSVDIDYQDNQLTVTVEPFGSDTETIVNSGELTVDAAIKGKDLAITVEYGDSSGTGNVSLPFVDESDFKDHVDAPIPDAHKYESDLSISATYTGEGISISISDGISQDTFELELPYLTAEEIGDLTQDIIIEEMTDSELLKAIKAQVNQIYLILGGSKWSFTENSASYSFKAEETIKNFGKAQFQSKSNSEKELKLNNLLDYITTHASIAYHRAGYHRLPLETVASLINDDDGNKKVTLYDAISFCEWFTYQFDAISGQFPIELPYKITDSSGKTVEQTIVIENNAEAIAELLGVLLNVAQDSDNAVNATIRCLAEARAGANAAIVAADYAKANADFLGDRGQDTQKEIPCSFTPGASTLRETLTESTKKIVSWRFDDKETLVELVKRLLFSGEIVKSALHFPWKPGEPVTGDRLKNLVDQKATEDDNQWNAFINRINNPTGKYKVTKPKSKAKDLTVDKQ